MAQYPVPQFIDSEAKIISFLTFRQFFILIGGGVVVLGLYWVLPLSFFYVGALFVIILTAAIAFLKVDGVSVVVIILNFLLFSTTKKNYVWKKKDLANPLLDKAGIESKNIKAFANTENKQSKLNQVQGLVEWRKK